MQRKWYRVIERAYGQWQFGLRLTCLGRQHTNELVTIATVDTEGEIRDNTCPPVNLEKGGREVKSQGAFSGRRFSELPLAPPLVSRLTELGMERAFEVQDKTLPLTLDGRDVIGRAITGSGKTLAFALPIAHILSKSAPGLNPRALVITPTRELCNQVAKSVGQLTRELRCVAVYGGDSPSRQGLQLRKGADVVCATPGRLNDHLTRGSLSLSNIQFLVLDEADELLTPGFLEQIRGVLKSCPPNKQTMLFSATMPQHIQRIGEEYMRDPVTVDLVSNRSLVPESVVHEVIRVPVGYKNLLVAALLREHQPMRAIVFISSKVGTGHMARYLRSVGIRAAPINSNMSQRDREHCLASFRRGYINVLCATDVAARGIDVPETDLVIQVGPPPSGIDFYIHRSGRTGRKGQAGQSIMVLLDGDNSSRFLVHPDDFLQQMSQQDIPFEMKPPPPEMLKETVKSELKRLLSVHKGDIETIRPLLNQFLIGRSSEDLLAAAMVILARVGTRNMTDLDGDRSFAKRRRDHNKHEWPGRSRKNSYTERNTYRGNRNNWNQYRASSYQGWEQVPFKGDRYSEFNSEHSFESDGINRGSYKRRLPSNRQRVELSHSDF